MGLGTRPLGKAAQAWGGMGSRTLGKKGRWLGLERRSLGISVSIHDNGAVRNQGPEGRPCLDAF